MLTQERLKELLQYDPETGVFTWRVANGSRAKCGDVAGGIDKHGYVRIGVDGARYKGHRLAWLYMTGEWPALDVDHRDMDRANNAWVNLRHADRRQNMANTGCRANNSCGFKGVHVTRHGNYAASIHLSGVKSHLGTFPTAEEAHAAYVKAANDNFGEFARAA